MGLFDFVKEAGRKLGLVAPEPSKPPQQVKAETEKAMSAALVKEVESHQLKIEDLRVEYSDGQAVVHGKTATQAEREKVILAVGNTEGVARVDDRIQVVTPEPEARFHTVVRGDTLSKIARDYYGNAMKYPVIFEANKPMLTDPDKIYPGQVLRIPPLN